MKTKQVIVIQVGSEGRLSAIRYFDQFGLKAGEHYEFFAEFGQRAMDLIEPDLPQLVFTSHAVDIDAVEVAARIKAKNPQAVVFALTSDPSLPSDRKVLDGAISKWSPTAAMLASDVACAFRAGADREDLRGMVANA